jgi:hypothetical protein
MDVELPISFGKVWIGLKVLRTAVEYRLLVPLV